MVALTLEDESSDMRGHIRGFVMGQHCSLFMGLMSLHGTVILMMMHAVVAGIFVGRTRSSTHVCFS